MTDRVCVQCEQPYTPKHKAQILCSLKCARRWKSRAMKGRRSPALLAKHQARLDAIQAAVRDELGELSTRDRLVFKWAWERAWKHGYWKAQAKHKREARMAA